MRKPQICVRCWKSCLRDSSWIQNMCSGCCRTSVTEANTRGFNLTVSPSAKHPLEFTMKGLKFWYWREWWRAEVAADA